MVVDVDLSADPASLSLVDPDDFSRFKVSVRGGDGRDSLVSALGRIGRVSEDGRQAFVALDSLQALAGAAGREEGWTTSLREMVSWAAARGWVAADGALQAHIEWR
jgi:hypothetical protein